MRFDGTGDEARDDALLLHERVADAALHARPQLLERVGRAASGRASSSSATRSGAATRRSPRDDVLDVPAPLRPTRARARRARRLRRPRAARRPPDDGGRGGRASCSRADRGGADARLPGRPPPRGHPGPRARARWRRSPSGMASCSRPRSRAARRRTARRSPPSSSAASGSTRPRSPSCSTSASRCARCPARSPTRCAGSGRRREDVGAQIALWASGAPTPELFAATRRARLSGGGARTRRSAGFVRFGRQEPQRVGAARRCGRLRAREVLGARRRRATTRRCGTPSSSRRARARAATTASSSSEWGGSRVARRRRGRRVRARRPPPRALQLACWPMPRQSVGRDQTCFPTSAHETSDNHHEPKEVWGSESAGNIDAPGRRLTMLARLAGGRRRASRSSPRRTHGESRRPRSTLKVLAQSNGQGNPQLQAIFDRFQQLNPSIKIDATYLPIGTTYANTLRTQLQGGNAPDVFYVTAGSGGLQSVLPLAKAGYVADLAEAAVGEDAAARACAQALLLAPGQADRAAVRRRAGRRHVPPGRPRRPRDPGAEDDEPVPHRVPHGEGRRASTSSTSPERRRRTPRSSRLSWRRATCSRRIPAGT